jgi:hypothetical protein
MDLARKIVKGEGMEESELLSGSNPTGLRQGMGISKQVKGLRWKVKAIPSSHTL